jgi:hypothetical protein
MIRLWPFIFSGFQACSRIFSYWYAARSKKQAAKWSFQVYWLSQSHGWFPLQNFQPLNASLVLLDSAISHQFSFVPQTQEVSHNSFNIVNKQNTQQQTNTAHYRKTPRSPKFACIGEKKELIYEGQSIFLISLIAAPPFMIACCCWISPIALYCRDHREILQALDMPPNMWNLYASFLSGHADAQTICDSCGIFSFMDCKSEVYLNVFYKFINNCHFLNIILVFTGYLPSKLPGYLSRKLEAGFLDLGTLQFLNYQFILNTLLFFTLSHAAKSFYLVSFKFSLKWWWNTMSIVFWWPTRFKTQVSGFKFLFDCLG